MFSSLPSTPGRGRSRFSKVLPVPPDASSPTLGEKPSLSMSTSYKSTLPPLPKSSKSSAMSIARRPVGGGPVNRSKALSIASVSSVYSDSPGLSRSLSDGSSSNTKDSLSGFESEVGPTPPIPPKDKQRNQERPQTPTNILASPISSLHSSPPRPEIWKRRSSKTERSTEISELKLEKSNGSTASPPRQQEQSTQRHQLPRSIGGRKPVPARPAPPQPALMGNSLAKLKKKKSEELSIDPSKDERFPPSFTSLQQPPTPEYLKAEKKEVQQMTPKLLSPVSPITPPEESSPPVVPLKSEFRNNNPAAAASENDRPNLDSHSREPSETLTVTSEPTVMRSPQPKKAFAAKILTPQPSPVQDSSVSLPSPVSDGPKAPVFPAFPSPATPGTVFPGPPLGIVHYECYQNHKYMRSSRNTLCPVACMVCLKKDTEMRWKCTWCCLSACGSCMKVLTTIPGKDLTMCLEQIKE